MSADFGRPQGMVSSVMAIVALVLGAAALYFGVSASKMKVEVEDRMAKMQDELTVVGQQAQSASKEVRQLDVSTQRSLIVIGTKIQSMESKLTPPAPVAPPAGSAGRGAAEGSAAGTYTVQANDTPDKIAKKLKITTDSLLKANPGLDARRMKIGAKLKVPAPAPAAAAAPAR